MARQSRTIDTPAKTRGSNSAAALSHLERMAGFVGESSRTARAAASIARAAGHRLQLRVHASLLEYAHRPETESFANRRTPADAFQSRLDNNPSRDEMDNARRTASPAELIRRFTAGARALNANARVRNGIGSSEAATSMARLKDPDAAIDGESRGGRDGRANAWHRTTASVDAGDRVSRKIRYLSLATDALSRVERSVESGSGAWAISNGGRRATESGLKASSDFAEQAHRANEVAQTMVVANAASSPRSAAGRVSSRSRGSLEAERVAFAGTGILASDRMASSIRAVIPPANLSQREFAEPSGNARGPNSSSVRTGITINSSPTVVINAPAAGGNVERDAIGALRAHREELFNQLKRESARRERVQF
jgi:hypothetical protein